MRTNITCLVENQVMIIMKFKKSFLMILLPLSAFASNEVFFQCATKDGTINLELIGKDLKLTMKKTTPFLLNALQNYWRGGTHIIIILGLIQSIIGLLTQLIMWIMQYIKITKMVNIIAGYK